MHKVYSFLFFLLSAQFASAQEVRVHITVLDTSFLPVSPIATSGFSCDFVDSGMDAISSTYAITSFQQAYPASWGLALRSVYEITASSDSVILALLAYRPDVFFGGEVVPETEVNCNTPSDYSGALTGGYQLDFIRADSAWCWSTGDSTAAWIGISDTYVDTTHFDLYKKRIGDSDPLFFNGNPVPGDNHGTSVAGLIAARNNNGAAASIGYHLKYKSNNLGFTTTQVQQMSKKGIKIINCSWRTVARCDTPGNFDPYDANFLYTLGNPTRYEQMVYNEIYENGSIAVFGAGNGDKASPTCGTANYEFPASYYHNLSITSVGHIGNTSAMYYNESKFNRHRVRDPNVSSVFYSHQHNDQVDLSAPGYMVDVLERQTGGPQTGWNYNSGTSFAAPFVTGTLGLMLSADKSAHGVPCLTPYQLEYILKTTANDDIYTETDNASYVSTMGLGAGKLDAASATKKAKFFNCNDPNTRTLIIEGIELNTKCKPGTVSGLNPVLKPRLLNVDVPGNVTYRWIPVNGNQVTLSSYTAANPTITSATGNLAWFILNVIETKSYTNAGGRTIQVPKIASKEFRVTLISDPDVWDLAMRDSYNDHLTEPNQQFSINARDWDIWKSPDLWNRWSKDGSPTHQNPEYFTLDSNYLYVRVKNVGCKESPSSGDSVKTYWTLASTGEQWTAHWTTANITVASISQPAGRQIGTKFIPQLNAGDELLIPFGWRPPRPESYGADRTNGLPVCVLGRIVTSTSAPYGMTFPESINTVVTPNVKNNNNIVTRNFVVTNINTSNRRTNQIFSVGNADSAARNFSLQVVTDRILNPHYSGNMSEYVEGSVYLGDLMDRWIDSGAHGVYSRYDVGLKTVSYDLSGELRLDNIHIDSNEQFPVQLTLQARTGALVPDDVTEVINVRQLYNPTGGEEEVYGNVSFEVNVRHNDTFDLYRRAHLGQEDQGRFTVFPNPATSSLTVESLDGEALVSVGVTDLAGRPISAYKKVDLTSGGSHIIDVAPLSSGIYFIKIIDSKGRICTKKFVKAE